MRQIAVAALLTALPGLGACKPKSRPGQGLPLEPAPPSASRTMETRSSSSADVVSAGVTVPSWPYWPERLRVHPLTRLVTDPATGQRLLEARIEFFDDRGATSKASGQLTLRLFADAALPDNAEPLETWNLNLRDLAINAQQYDDVTRTYLMRLQIDPARLTAAPELRAYFVGANGALLNGTMPLKP